MNPLPCKDSSLCVYCIIGCCSSIQFKHNWNIFKYILLFHTYEFIRFVQPGKQFLTVAVVNWDAHEMTLADEVWLGTGVAGI